MIWVDHTAKFLNLKQVTIEQENKVIALQEGYYGLHQLCRPCCNNIDPNSSVSPSNSDICTCKFKLIAFVANYSMKCIRPDPLRASVRVWLCETSLEFDIVRTYLECEL